MEYKAITASVLPPRAVSGSAASAVTAVWFKTARSPAQNANNFFMGKPPCNQLL